MTSPPTSSHGGRSGAGRPEEDRFNDLSHSQKQIWVGQRLHPESPLYNMAFAFVFPAELDAERFREAWRQVVQASDVLRTRIVEEDGQGRARISKKEASETEILDLSRREDPEEDFRRWCRARSARVLPLNGTLVESVLVLLGDGRTGWFLSQHHLVADAWSTQLLFGQVSARYKALGTETGAGSEAETNAGTGIKTKAGIQSGTKIGSEAGDGIGTGPGTETEAETKAGGGAGGEAGATATPGTLEPPPYYPTAEAVRVRGEAARPRAKEEAAAHWAQRRAGRTTTQLYGTTAEPKGTASVRRTLQLDEARSRALEALAAGPGFASLSPEVSRFSLFAALLLAWLYRVGSGEPAQELGFDAPVTGRPTAEAKRALGLFIEMFPFRARVGPRETFRSLGARCLKEAMLFLRHALPATSAPTGATARSVVLNYFPVSFPDFAGLKAAADWVHPGHGDSVHALRLQVHDFAGTGRTVFHFDFNEGALPESLQHRGLEHFERLLDAVLEDPDRPLAGLDLRTAEERRETLGLAEGSTLQEEGGTVVDRFLSRAATEPERIALRQGVEEVTFGELKAGAEALAARLVELGVEPGDRVALLSRRSLGAVTAILGILRARAAYVPLAPSAPTARLSQALEDSGARILLVGEGIELEPPPGINVLPIAEGLRGGGPGIEKLPKPGRDDLAYLLYTSGSTGHPKGVLVGHDGLADYLAWAADRYVRGDRLTFPLFTSLTFDLTVTSLFLPLITGGTLEIYPEPEGPADTAVMDVAEANSVDFIKLTPSHLSLLERAGLEGSRLRRLVVGGESFPARLAAAVQSQLGGEAEIHNEYGPTEAVVGCIAHLYDEEQDRGASVPIGEPAEHVEAWVVNHLGTPVPSGVPGELWVSLPGLARGYHRRPALTAERFLPHPERVGERLYRTGDLVRRIPGGGLDFLGRIDRQLKIAGFRVEPGEVEAALLTLPEVQQAAVLPRSPRAAAAAPQEERFCSRCGLPSSYPRATFDDEGVCGICRTYEAIRGHAQAYFKTMDELEEVFRQSAANHEAPYDCLMLYSGGKDSTYALCRLVEMGLSVYAFTLDNGFISEGALANVRKVREQLGVAGEIAATPAMNAIFRDSLERFANVCNGCFKTIYTLGVNKARELGVPILVTGLSRGQMFETRLTEEMFRGGRYSPEEVDAAVLEARKVYHRVDDEVARSLDVSLFQDDRIFEEVRFVDFYRYCDVSMDELYAYLKGKVPWVRPEDTGRSTNCLINDLGIYVHQRRRGFHNYALPYSWDVRMGHKTREEAMEELDDDIAEAYVRKTLAAIGYGGGEAEALLEPEEAPAALEAFYVASGEVREADLRQALSEVLPSHLIPARFHPIDEIPLTPNGKVDGAALSRLAASQVLEQAQERPYRPPEGPVEELLAELWQEELGLPRVGADDDFFELGGTSLASMQVVLRLCQELDLELPLGATFSHPTLAKMARLAEDKLLDDVAAIPEEEKQRLLDEADPSS